MLRYSDRQIQEIAEYLHYGSVSHFLQHSFSKENAPVTQRIPGSEQEDHLLIPKEMKQGEGDFPDPRWKILPIRKYMPKIKRNIRNDKNFCLGKQIE